MSRFVPKGSLAAIGHLSPRAARLQPEPTPRLRRDSRLYACKGDHIQLHDEWTRTCWQHSCGDLTKLPRRGSVCLSALRRNSRNNPAADGKWHQNEPALQRRFLDPVSFRRFLFQTPARLMPCGNPIHVMGHSVIIDGPAVLTMDNKRLAPARKASSGGRNSPQTKRSSPHCGGSLRRPRTH